MRRIAMFALADDSGGQWQYETSVLRELAVLAPKISCDRVRTRGMRSTSRGELRLPYETLAALPGPVQRVATRLALRGYALVHRCALRLPSARREVLTIHATAWVHDEAAPAPPESSRASVARAHAVIA